MRVLLVTWTDQLLQNLSILNPELEYCAIVTDEVELAKKNFERAGLRTDLIHPLYELKECVKNFYYDYVLCIENGWWQTSLSDALKDYDAPQEKILNFCALLFTNNFLLERSFRYFKEHATEFEMFATGISYVEKCLDITKFKRKLFNFGRGSQDLYYNFQTAKFAISIKRGGGLKLNYALIGLAPYSFHYDLSNTPRNQFILLQHLIAFGDLHNFHVPNKEYRKIFSEKYLSTKIPLEPFDLNDPFMVKGNLGVMTPYLRLISRKNIDTWSKRYFQNTRDENIKILDDYLTLCEKNKIRPIIFLPPMSEGYVKYFSKQKLDEFYYIVNCAIKKHPSAVFVDGFNLPFLTDRDFADVDHLNTQGASKFSIFLNEFIEGL